MRYLISVRSRVTAKQGVIEKHSVFLKNLAKASPEFLQGKVASPGEPRSEPLVEVSLKTALPKHLKGKVTYQNRNYLRDEAVFDDYVSIDLDPQKVAYHSIVTVLFPALVDSFGAYRAHIADEEFIFTDFDVAQGLDLRRSVPRVYPVMFLDRSLCSVALRLSPEEIVDGCGGVARLHADGVIIEACQEVLSFEESRRLSDQLTAILTQSVH